MTRLLATSAFALIAGAAPLFADVTPAQAWENLQKYYESFGYELATGNVEDAGNTLTVTDFTMTAKAEEGQTVLGIPKMVFEQTGDAKVRSVIEGEMSLSSKFQVEDYDLPEEDPEATGEGETADDQTGTDAPQPKTYEMEMTGTAAMPDNEMLISGTPEDMLYEFNYPSFTANIQFPVDPKTEAKMPLTIVINNTKGTQRNTTGDGTATEFDMTAESLNISSDMDIPAEGQGAGGKMNFVADMNALTMKGSGHAPAEKFDLNTQLAQALAAGMRFDGVMTFGGITGTVKANQDAGPDGGQPKTLDGTFSSGAGEYSMTLASEGMGYKSTADGGKLNLTVSDVPFPINVSMDKTAIDFLMPVEKSEEAQPYKLVYSIAGLTLDDGIWNLFDPNKQLPRDPANLTIDVAGDALVTKDIFDPASMEAQPDGSGGITTPEPPAMPKSLKINQIALDMVGAKVDLNGDLTFDEANAQPLGKINGSFEGVNGLLDKAVAMGLVPQDQLMGMRMMLAMFAKPVDGQADKMATEIEFREGGSIFANGQQVK